MVKWKDKCRERMVREARNGLKKHGLDDMLGCKVYLAYGSNLNFDQMEARCPEAVPLGPTTLKGMRLVFRGGYGSGVLTVEPAEGSEVPAFLFLITERDEAALDRYEGFPRFYHKETVEAELEGKALEAMVYIMNEGHPYATPSCYYYSVCREGYGDCGLDEDCLKEAADFTAEMERANG